MNAYGADVDAICVHVSLDLRSLPAKPQPANRCPPPLNLRWDQCGLTSRYWSERQRRAQKLFLEEGGRTQNVNRSLEIRLRRHKTRSVRWKCDAKRVPLRGKRLLEEGGGTQHTRCQPFSRNTSCLGTQNADHSAKIHHLRGHKTLTVQQK